MRPHLIAAALLGLSCASEPTDPPTPADGAADASAEVSTGPDAPSPDVAPEGGTDAGSPDVAEAGRDAAPDALPVDRPVTCPAGMTWCGSFCSALDTTANCGGCGDRCCDDATCPPGRNRTNACIGGTCGRACLAGYGDCDSNPDNGCEVMLNSDRACGSCTVDCTGRPHTTRGSCVGTDADRRCSLTCAAGFSNCDGMSDNGCEASLTSDPTNCGACGRVCMMGYFCRDGVCAR